MESIYVYIYGCFHTHDDVIGAQRQKHPDTNTNSALWCTYKGLLMVRQSHTCLAKETPVLQKKRASWCIPTCAMAKISHHHKAGTGNMKHRAHCQTKHESYKTSFHWMSIAKSLGLQGDMMPFWMWCWKKAPIQKGRTWEQFSFGEIPLFNLKVWRECSRK